MSDRTPPPRKPRPRRRIALAVLALVCVAGVVVVALAAESEGPHIALAVRQRDWLRVVGGAFAVLQVPCAAAALALMVRARWC